MKRSNDKVDLNVKWYNSNRKRILPPVQITKSLARIRIDLLKDLLYMVSEKTASELVQLEKEYDKVNSKKEEQSEEDYMYQEHLQGQYEQLGSIDDLSSHLAIIGLYRIVERLSGSIYRRIFKGYPKICKRVYIWDKQREIVRKHLSCDICNTAQYAAVDELRLINNAIKHEDSKITDKLKQYPRWQAFNVRENLPNLREDFNRLAPCVPVYLEDLVESLNRQLIIIRRRTKRDDED